MADPTPIPNELVREIQAEMQREKLHALARRYSGPLVVAALLVIAGVGGTQAWRSYQHNQQEQQGDAFFTAWREAREGTEAKALNLLQPLTDTTQGYGLLARLQRADLLARSGKPDAALQAYAGFKGTELEPLAQLKSAMLLLKTNKDAIPTLQPLAQAGQPYAVLAKELLVAAYLQAGKPAEAKTLLNAMRQDASLPPTVKERAANLLAQLE
jgi:hypothetical protein